MSHYKWDEMKLYNCIFFLNYAYFFIEPLRSSYETKILELLLSWSVNSQTSFFISVKKLIYVYKRSILMWFCEFNAQFWMLHESALSQYLPVVPHCAGTHWNFSRVIQNLDTRRVWSRSKAGVWLLFRLNFLCSVKLCYYNEW